MDNTFLDEVLFMQTRLLRLAHYKWHKTDSECADIFTKYDVYNYISDSYGIFHVQGDDANMEDINLYLKNKGCKI